MTQALICLLCIVCIIFIVITVRYKNRLNNLKEGLEKYKIDSLYYKQLYNMLDYECKEIRRCIKFMRQRVSDKSIIDIIRSGELENRLDIQFDYASILYDIAKKLDNE